MRIAGLLSIFLLVSCSPETPTTSDTVAAEPPAAAAETAAGEATEGGLGAGPCAYMSEAEASTIMGHTMKFVEGNDRSQCTLHSASGDRTKSMSFQVTPGTMAYDQTAAAPGHEKVSGVGENAVVSPVTNLVVAVKGGRSYMGGVFDAAAPESVQPKSIELAKRVTARM